MFPFILGGAKLYFRTSKILKLWGAQIPCKWRELYALLCLIFSPSYALTTCMEPNSITMKKKKEWCEVYKVWRPLRSEKWIKALKKLSLIGCISNRVVLGCNRTVEDWNDSVCALTLSQMNRRIYWVFFYFFIFDNRHTDADAHDK